MTLIGVNRRRDFIFVFSGTIGDGDGGGVSDSIIIGGENGLSTIGTLSGLMGFEIGGDIGVFGSSTMGLGVRCGTKSDCPVDRKIPFLTGHGALLLLDILYDTAVCSSQISRQ